jgi:alpha-galactosidase
MSRVRTMLLIAGLLLTAAGPRVALAAGGGVAPGGGAPSRGSLASLSPTPPMGWNSWYHFGCGIDEALYKRTARKIVSSGMAAAGYRYVQVDDCWMTRTRDASGALQPNRLEFPDGISGLASYVHALGLKLGIYLDVGTATCTGFPGSAGHFSQDIHTIASWGVDYVKVDYCRARPAPAKPIYNRIQKAIAATHRAMVLNVCEWGYQSPWLWAPNIATSWRTTGDYFSYGAPQNYWKAMLKVADLNERLSKFSRPGAYNDPNQMLVGTGVLNAAEERSQMSLWSMMAAPLTAGGDFRYLSSTTLQALTNREVIAIDQDPAGLQGKRVTSDSARQVWVRQLRGGSRALLLLNTRSVPVTIQLDVSQIGLSPATKQPGSSSASTPSGPQPGSPSASLPAGPPAASSYVIRDLWQHSTWQTPGPVSLRIGPHDVRMLRVTP